MSEVRKQSPPAGPGGQSAAAASSSALPQPEPPTFRGRLPSSAFADLKSPSSASSPLPRRRSSILSFTSLDDTRHSARDFIRPGLGFGGDDNTHAEEPSHWHSSPIAFAFLPALAGLFFTNGSAFVTDILLLGLAALFLNWSVRIPWDWYHSAQAITTFSQSRRSSITLADVDEATEEDRDVYGPGGASKSDGAPQPQRSPVPEMGEPREDVVDATSRLRRYEIFALLMTFVMPAGAAYLLHVIRGQLSRPSEGLVSDYNLTIFLLAAEIRPVRQLIRLVTNRTLHLQRVAYGNLESTGTALKREKTLEGLVERLAALESNSNNNHNGMVSGTLPNYQEAMAGLSADMKRRYEPRLDALERAVRRYEKRATTLTLLTEQRLQSLESRLQDALSLAAVAAQSNNKPGLIVAILSTFSRILLLPFEAAWLSLVWPLQAVESIVEKVSEFIYGRPKRRSRRSDSARARSRASRKKDEAYFGKHH